MSTPQSLPKSATLVLLLGIAKHFRRRRRLQLLALMLVMLASGLAELLSLAAVIPFLGVLTNPQQLWGRPWLRMAAAQAGLTEPSQLLVPITALFALLAVVAGSTRLFNLWLNGRLAAAIGSDLSTEAYRRTLYQPYAVHVERHSSSVTTVITIQIGRAVVALNAVLQVLTAAVVSACLLLALLLVDWQVAFTAAWVFGLAYAFIAYRSRSALQRNSRLIAEATATQLKALQEGLGSIRDVLLDGNQNTYLEIYRSADQPNRVAQARNQFLSASPRFILETLGLVFIAGLALVLLQQRQSELGLISLLGTLAFGAQRLLPSLQQIYAGWATVSGVNADLAAVLAMLQQPMPPPQAEQDPLPLRQGLRAEALSFRYGSSQPEVLHAVDLEIRRGQRVGFIGSTGSGKSTLIDLLMGLLSPSAGRILIDGVDLHNKANPERLLAWRAAIAHVPQMIYLADRTVAENIAFGLPTQHIDMVRVRQAAQQAQIASFIESRQAGYQSMVGERGIRLSGGQRQRIGIARALYKQSQVIVFDEATSALDSETETAVMESIDQLSRDLTLVLIAHRLSTVRGCDQIYRLEQGRIVAQGPPSSVLQSD